MGSGSAPTGSESRPSPGVSGAYVLFSLAITLLSCLINLPGVNHSEVIDDHDLLHNPIARGCGRNPTDCFRHPQFGLYYRPLMGVSFSIGEDLHGQDPLPFHVENLVLHAIVMLEGWWAFRLILRRETGALLAALVYGVHPLQVPVTAFIGGRTDTLALVFVFWFVIATVKSAESRHKLAWRAAALAGFTLGVFCKEQCAMLIVLMPLLVRSVPAATDDVANARKPVEPWMALFVLPIAALAIAAKRVIPPHAIDVAGWHATRTQVAWDLGLRIEMVGRTLWFFARCFLWPAPDTIHQSTLGPWDAPQPWAALGGFLAAGAWIALTLHTLRDRRLRIFSVWVILTLLPCVNIVPIPSQFTACYRAAIPLFGVAGLAGAAFDRLIAHVSRDWRSRASLVVPAAVAGALAILSISDVPLWASDEALTRAEYHADPNFLPALAGLATTLRRLDRRKEALEVNDRVVARLFPTQTTLQARIAALDTPWMLRHVKSESSLRYQPRAFVDYVMRERGGCAQELGLTVPAIEDYRLALAALPEDYEVADALVYCSEASGNYEEARKSLEYLAARAPTANRLQHLGTVDMHLGLYADAKRNLARALALAAREKGRNSAPILQLYEQAAAVADYEQARKRKKKVAH